MYKLITCDLDETLLQTDRQISKTNIEAIRKAREKGVKFVPASGRGYATIQGTLETLGLKDEKDEYLISFNGGAITENHGNRLLYFQGISFEKAQQLFARGRAFDVCIHVYTQEEVYVFRMDENERDFLNNRMEVIEFDEPNLDFLKGQEIVKILYVNTDYEYLRMIESSLKDLTEDMDVSFSSNRYIEFNHKGVNKGSGLRQLAAMLNISLEETMAIGDNFNDLTMIQAAGKGVGVQNTIEDMKPLCDHITFATNDESAVAEALETFVL